MTVKLPFSKIDSEEFAEAVQLELLDRLEAASQQTGKGKARKRNYVIWSNSGKMEADEQGREITGWKFNEWDYGKPKIVLASQSRGLFTRDNKIVVRGYDKFFNIGEVATTKWDWIESNVRGPFEVTQKENGCILFFSGLEDGTLLVCSKHSTGPVNTGDKSESPEVEPLDQASSQDLSEVNMSSASRDKGGSRSHSFAGLLHLKRHLKAKDLTLRDLALTLHELNATAVAELCDDEFEEHVLAYSAEEAGIYLHGLNLNTPTFSTYPSSRVREFAETFGLRHVKTLDFESISDLKKFLTLCDETGQYESKDIEGFVVRGKTGNSSSDFFFKYKFDEPYLMYRGWREVTRKLINKGRAEVHVTKHVHITNQYLDFVEPILAADKARADKFLDGHGIIGLRDEFLHHLGKSGKELSLQEDLGNLTLHDQVQHIVILPIATIGCGKTTVSLALHSLFGWHHIQSDNIKGTGVGRKMVQEGCRIIRDGDKEKKSQVIILDRNNSNLIERKQLFDEFDRLKCNPIFVCMSFVDGDDQVREKLARDRVLKRGENHQSIKVETMGMTRVDQIMRDRCKKMQGVNKAKEPDSRFDLVIECAVAANVTWQNLETVAKEMSKEYEWTVPKLPSREEYEAAFAAALNYAPTVSNLKKPQKLKPQYVAVAVCGVNEVLSKLGSPFLAQLTRDGRVQEEFHVTLAHVAEKKNNNYHKLLSEYVAKLLPHLESGVNPIEKVKFQIHVPRAIWNGRVFALEVDSVQGPQDETLLASIDHTSLDKFLHVTIGTAEEAIRPMESGPMVQKWVEGEREGMEAVDLDVTLHGHLSAFV
ncbi:RNA ligase-domain-containing protein [Yarrowia lipolytica]|uniref:tRNA ligase n=1 Tax=Yarrowia lipolytica TaxID=4952 RepID=A0A371C5S7_YARLL|nr:RNA ligase-domain-containing protein [Yarrowia lipolytica]RDW33587.1 RNA ligase-domain-containing protein [Yarrowia lipolytica]RDW37525.1 RNA ligase-domain-containing protein [Yarrowia lipolytica]RDW47500.1 RNA ligase-domain-containing protein [Yarrowia lipolytica]RDW53272.1 RNA ligase-domain-containing protein [Yarrowia lipolytica]